MKKIRPTIIPISLMAFLIIQPVSAQSISGHIEAVSKVKKMIIYLEANDTTIRPKITKSYQVSQKNTDFHPPLTVINSGDTIQWLNDEKKEIDHNIFSLSQLRRFDLGLGERGSKLEQHFDKTGVLNYYCSVHKNMEGKVVVLPSRYYQILEHAGDFMLDSVPEGNWTLKAIVFHRRYKIEPISFKIGAQALTKFNLKVVKR